MSIKSDKEDGDWAADAAANFDFVRFTFSDINGISHCKLIPRRHVDEKLKTGITTFVGRLYGRPTPIYTDAEGRRVSVGSHPSLSVCVSFA